jgi:Secretion system C-terminal sorting domain
MNRFIYLLAITLYCANPISAQSLCNQVIASAGASLAPIQGMHIAYTIGEPVSFIASDATHLITQGFHQPEICLLTSVTGSVGGQQLDVEVFPNPAIDRVRIKLSEPLPIPVDVLVYDLHGRLLDVHQMVAGALSYDMLINQWPAGYYVLHMRDPQGNQVASFPLLKTAF